MKARAGSTMQLPPSLQPVLAALATVGRPLLVGGCVRDWLLGLEPKDFDIEVFGLSYEELVRVLRSFGPADLVGKSFGVVKLRLPDGFYDFSLPRRETKAGPGHRGFAIMPEHSLGITQAAARRDFTINAIAYDPITGEILDPFEGRKDLASRRLRHTSAAFSEDPLRVLRGFQFAARFDLEIAPETADLCRSILPAFAELPVERVWGEWAKWAVKSTVPSRGIEVLEASGWIRHFPELAALDGVPQDPGWHPEGDVLRHTKFCLDSLARDPNWKASSEHRRQYLTLAVLAHDLGKATTTVLAERRGTMRWISPGHESAGGALAESFLERIGAPRELVAWVRPLVENHLIHHNLPKDPSAASIRRLARKLAPATIDDLCTVMTADHLGRPPLTSEESLERIENLRQWARRLDLEKRAPRPILLGRHLIRAGLPPGPEFKPILDACFEAQLEGVFEDEAAGIEFLQKLLEERGITGG